MKQVILLGIFSLLALGCKDSQESTLPMIGNTIIVDGVKVAHQVPDWTFVNQDSVTVSNTDLSDFIYVSDFFLRSCPTICPKVAREMKKVYTEFIDNPQVKFVSFTLDPKRDTPEKLKEYAANLGVDDNKWWFIHGDKDEIYELTAGYMQIGYEDASVPGGFDHSGKLILTDKAGHIRSFSEGTDPSDTPKLIKDIKILLKEYDAKP